jgi:glycosyltransferase involved in cell wall biosynthesis
MSATHRLLGTWDRQVAVYIALTEFARDRMVEGGLPADRIVVKPNFVYPDPGEGSGNGGYALFVGRLSPEKGIDTLLEAWRTLSPEIPLHIVGDGPLAPEVATAALEMDNVSWLGWRNASDVATLVADAKFLVCPSNWYEGCSRVVLEAFAAGTPVIASNIGSLAEMVSDGISGRLMLPGDSQSLIRAARALSSGQVDLPAMRAAARRVFDERFTSAANYEMLMSIYRTAMQRGAPGATARASSESS